MRAFWRDKVRRPKPWPMTNFHPKVLFITPCAFNKITGGGITFSNLFLNWPKEKLATVTGDPVPVRRDVCKEYFFLTPGELKYVRPFSCLPLNRARKIYAEKNSYEKKRFLNSWSIFPFVRSLIGEAGIPDSGTLSKELKAWVADFRPDLLYTILGSPGYIDLVLKTQAEFDLPLVIHLMDDGVTDPKRRGLFGSYLRLLYKKKFNEILARTHLALAICEAMASEYSRRYGVPFIHFQNTLDLEKWVKFSRKDVSVSEKRRIVYIGSILKNAQLQSLLDCCQAVKSLNGQGIPAHLDIFTPRMLLSDNYPLFESSPTVKVHEIPENDENFFFLLGQADVLLLPVNFDSGSVHFVRLSMPTKVPAYLMSGTPILVYGPAGVAQVEYARDYGWGLVVDRRDSGTLARSLRVILEDLGLRQELSGKAMRVAKENHDAKRVRAAFQEALCKVAAEKGITG